jgi:hypothetical protein
VRHWRAARLLCHCKLKAQGGENFGAQIGIVKCAERFYETLLIEGADLVAE